MLSQSDVSRQDMGCQDKLQCKIYFKGSIINFKSSTINIGDIVIIVSNFGPHMQQKQSFRDQQKDKIAISS